MSLLKAGDGGGPERGVGKSDEVFLGCVVDVGHEGDLGMVEIDEPEAVGSLVAAAPEDEVTIKCDVHNIAGEEGLTSQSQSWSMKRREVLPRAGNL